MKATALILLACASVIAQEDQPKWGILGQMGPRWDVREWIQTPAGFDRIDVTDYRGQMLVVMGFQAYCPSCHTHGFPRLKELVKTFGKDRDVAFLAMQTTFEGFDHNDRSQLEKIAKRYDLKMPVAHDPGTDGKRSDLLRRYRTGGTPWFIVLDHRGVVRLNAHWPSVQDVRQVIETARKQRDAELAELQKAVSGIDALPTARPFVARKEPRLVRFVRPESDEDRDATRALLRRLRATKTGASHLRLKSNQPKPRLVLVVVGTGAEADPGAALEFARETGFEGELRLDVGGAMRDALSDTRALLLSEAPTLLLDARGGVTWAEGTEELRPKATAPRQRAAWRRVLRAFPGA